MQETQTHDTQVQRLTPVALAAQEAEVGLELEGLIQTNSLNNQKPNSSESWWECGKLVLTWHGWEYKILTWTSLSQLLKKLNIR